MQHNIDDFADYLRLERMRSETTIVKYLAVLKELSAFAHRTNTEPKKSIASLGKNELTAFLRNTSQHHGNPSKSGWNLRLAGLRSYYDYLYKKEVISMNPAMRIDRMRPDTKETVPLNLDELLALLDGVGASSKLYRARNRALVLVMFHSALRVAEVVSLNTDHVDFSNNLFLDIRTKGGNRISLPFPDLVAEALQQHLSSRNQADLGRGSKALFVSNRGTRISVRAVQSLLTDYGKKAGISRPVTPHLLRHSGATELAELGTPMRVVQDICGHASIVTTERYVHPKINAKRQAIVALGEKVAMKIKARQEAAKSGLDTAPLPQ